MATGSKLTLRRLPRGGGYRLKRRATIFLRRVCRLQIRRKLGKLKVVPRFLSRLGTKLRQLRAGGRFLLFGNSGSGYIRLDKVEDRLMDAVPKGHLAVYVGRKDEEGGSQRVFVPVIYMNHPLFVKLLREAEETYGFCHPGGITIPCQVSEFERVRTRIAAGRLS